MPPVDMYDRRLAQLPMPVQVARRAAAVLNAVQHAMSVTGPWSGLNPTQASI